MQGPFYYASRVALRAGERIRPFDLSRHDAKHKALEAIFESVRQDEYPSKPPRLGSVFLCPSLSGFCRPGDSERKHLYEVKVSGARKVHWANAEMWTEATFNSKDKAADYADSYWRVGTSRESWHFFKEVLVYGGSVTVIGPVSESSVESLVGKYLT